MATVTQAPAAGFSQSFRYRGIRTPGVRRFGAVGRRTKAPFIGFACAVAPALV